MTNPNVNTTPQESEPVWHRFIAALSVLSAERPGNCGIFAPLATISQMPALDPFATDPQQKSVDN